MPFIKKTARYPNPFSFIYRDYPYFARWNESCSIMGYQLVVAHSSVLKQPLRRMIFQASAQFRLLLPNSQSRQATKGRGKPCMQQYCRTAVYNRAAWVCATTFVR
jgi:hypothetical protein